jgi:ubiquitin thioesterase OTU1
MTSQMKSLHLKCKTKTGQHLIESLTDQDTVQELKAILSSLTGILLEKLKILSGYPPKYLDLTNGNQKLGTIFNQNMETLIIEEINEKSG